jgi:hypothetical protein
MAASKSRHEKADVSHDHVHLVWREGSLSLPRDALRRTQTRTGEDMPDVLIPTVRNVRDVGKKTNDTQIYVGRRTKWGNPYKISETYPREAVIRLFKVHLDYMLQLDPDFCEPLRGKDLVCWCAPLACHADLLLEVANR